MGGRIEHNASVRLVHFICCHNMWCVFSAEGGRKSANKPKDTVSEPAPAEEEPVDKGFWITTMPSGERVATQAGTGKVPVRGAQVCVASDPQTGQVMEDRMGN